MLNLFTKLFKTKKKEAEPVKPAVKKKYPKVDGWILVNKKLNLYNKERELIATMPEELLDIIATKQIKLTDRKG